MDETIVAKIDNLNLDSALEPYLIIIAGAHIGKLYDLNGTEFVGGRSRQNDIWIEDNTISRSHFRIRCQNNQYIIEDLNSTNGTFVNNKRIQSAVLKSGDKIQISKDTIIQFDFYDETRKIHEQKRYEMGVKDPYTNAYNKSFFFQRIAEEFSFSQRQSLPLSLVMFDIDHFKVINDKYGHLAGDQVLTEICDLVMLTIRNDDIFCRYGGEEFIVMMRNTKCQDAVNLAERIRLKIAQKPVMFENQKILVTASFGVATYLDQNFRDYVALLSEADKFLYKSKGEGRNRVSATCKPLSS